MLIYKIQNNLNDQPCAVICSDGWTIPFATDNSDYQTFKAQINDESAQLEDADGVLMSAEDAKAYVATLP